MDTFLQVLFESSAKVKLLRLFVQNQDRDFTAQEIEQLIQVKRGSFVRDLNKLIDAYILQPNVHYVQPKDTSPAARIINVPLTRKHLDSLKEFTEEFLQWAKGRRSSTLVRQGQRSRDYSFIEHEVASSTKTEYHHNAENLKQETSYAV